MMSTSNEATSDSPVASQLPGHDEGQRGTSLGAPPDFRITPRLICVFVVLCLLSFMGAIDATIVTTSLPTITSDIGGERVYVWIANGFLFGSTIPQPLVSQVSDIFGRRNPLLISITLFALGSGLAGGASNPARLIAGRTVQGLGSAGLYVLSDIIICDLVPARYRGPYLSAVLGTASLGTTLGPIVGGALARANWRWIFWLNLPISGIGLVAMVLFLNVSHNRSSTWGHAFARVDFIGFAIFAPSMVAILFGLDMGGTTGYAWGSYRIVVPLVLGLVGMAAFHVHQASRFCKQPTMPPRLFQNRTSVAGFVMVFLGSLLIQAINYFLPIYFQAVKGKSPLLSGVFFLAFALPMIFWGGMTGAVLDKTGRYQPLHFLAFGLCTIAVGLFSNLDASSSTGKWVGYQILASAGPGIVLTITLPSTLAALSDRDVAVGTGTYSFIRSLGFTWGTDIAAIIFNGRIDAHLAEIGDSDVRALMSDGAAYSYASQGTNAINTLPEPTKSQVISVYVQALRVVWWTMAAFSALGFLFAFVERHIELRKVVETDFGFVDESQGDPPHEVAGNVSTVHNGDQSKRLSGTGEKVT